MGLYLNGGGETVTELPGESVEAIENERMLGSFTSVKDQIKASNGLISVSMGQLRNVHGVARLGSHVCNRISEELRSAGIGHHPERLPLSQKVLVRLFLLDSPMARLFSDVSTITLEADWRLSALVNVYT